MKFSDFPERQRGSGVEVRTPGVRLRARDVARVIIVAALCAALAFLGAGPAFATGPAKSPVAQDEVDPAHTTPATSETASTAPQTADSVTSPPQTPAAELPTPEPVSPKPTVPLTSSIEVKRDTPGQREAQSQVITSAAPETPYLRWTVADAQGAAVTDTTFTVQAARDGAVVADGETEWAAAFTAIVTDNAGQTGYVGADLDPTPGVFAVKTLTDDANPARTHEIVDTGEVDRVRLASGPAQYKVGEAATWVELNVTVDAASKATPIAAELIAAVNASTGRKLSANKAGDSAVMPLVAGAPDGAPAPYVYWDVVDQNGSPVAGATFSLEQGNNNNNNNNNNSNSWTGARNVTDCVSGTCTLVDRDNDLGEFLVKWINSDKPGANPGNNTTAVTADGRYRVRPVTPPTGYTWAASTGWIDSNTKTWAGATNNRTLNFGTFAVTKVNYAPSCVAGYVYGIQDSGQIRQVAPGGAVTDLGSASGLSGAEFNGLGIGNGGSPVYAYSRGGTGNSSSNVGVYQYSPATGKWVKQNVQVDSTTGNVGSVTFVAGAVNLDTGNYFVGGYRGEGAARIFRLWEYVPSSSTVLYKGAVSTPGEGNANGDIAFDANGNLFVVRGADTTTTIYSVTAANLAAANGGTIPSSSSTPVKNTTKNVNGVAFDADGKGFLSGDQEVQSYDMPGWTNKSTVTSGVGLNGSTDLASCSSPPTITIEKVVEGGRVAATDQFSLALKQGTTTISTATTTGNNAGVQPDRIGPLPTVRNVPLTFSESAAGTTNLNNYVSSYRCLVDGVQVSQGNGTTGTVTIPAGGQAVNCQFYNSPLAAQVTIHKDVTDAQGENPQPREGWTVGATAIATTGTATGMADNPAKSTMTNAQGNATWSYRFGAKRDIATVKVYEQMMTGYTFQRGECVVTHLNGTTTAQTLTGPADQAIPGIVPGDRVECTYVNRLQPNELTLIKKVNNAHGGTGVVADWTLTADGPTAGVTGKTGDDTITNAAVLAGEYTLTESGGPKGYAASDWACVNEDSTLDTSGGKVTVPPGGKVVCTITNSDLPGSVTWSKVETGTTDLLGGSVWKLTGPAADGTADTTTEVEDCTSATCAGMQDQNPAAGKFLVEGLPWGTYQLQETRAPLGYLLDTSTTHTFVISGGTLEVTVDAINNDPVTPPEIPLTGGFGSELYTFLGLGVLALAAAAIGVIQIRKRRA